MTPQQIFDAAYRGVMQQGRQSMSPGIFGKGCKYRGPNGLKCAVGFLISDQAAKAWDRSPHSSIGARITSKSKFVEQWMRDNRHLLESIQRAHDNDPEPGETFTQSFDRRMRRIAKDYLLEIPE